MKKINNLRNKANICILPDRILAAMAFPASGIEATYRNDIDEVSRMLETYHKNNYMIWNLR